jgi:hypothetical protein
MSGAADRVPGASLDEELAERVHELAVRALRTGEYSAVLVDASRYARLEAYIPVCAWCGRIGLGGAWIERSAAPPFALRLLAVRSTHGICPACFAEQPAPDLG